MAYLSPNQVITRNDPQLLALRKNCGLFCFVTCQTVKGKWLVSHNERRTEVELGSLGSAVAWIKALHYMSGDELGTIIHHELFSEYHIDHSLAANHCLGTNYQQQIIIGPVKFVGYIDLLATERLRDAFDMHVRGLTKFQVVDSDHVPFAEVVLTNFEMGPKRPDGRANMRLTFRGASEL